MGKIGHGSKTDGPPGSGACAKEGPAKRCIPWSCHLTANTRLPWPRMPCTSSVWNACTTVCLTSSYTRTAVSIPVQCAERPMPQPRPNPSRFEALQRGTIFKKYSIRYDRCTGVRADTENMPIDSTLCTVHHIPASLGPAFMTSPISLRNEQIVTKNRMLGKCLKKSNSPISVPKWAFWGFHTPIHILGCF